MSNKRINELTNIFEFNEEQLDGNYLVVDNPDNGTSKYNLQSLFEVINNKYSQTNLIERIETLEKRITEMNIELPSQLVDLDSQKFYNQLNFIGSNTDCFDEKTKRFRIGGGTDEESGDPSKIVMKFNHETIVGIMIDYIGIASESSKQYYFEIVEVNGNGYNDTEHVIDRVTSMDTLAHSYQRWVKVYNGSQLYIDIYNTATTGAKTTVSSIFPMFKIHVFMYSDSPLVGWSTNGTISIQNYLNMSVPHTLDIDKESCLLLINGNLRAQNAGYWGWESNCKFSVSLNAINEYKESTTSEGTYTNTVASKLNIKIMPTVTYASKPSDIDLTLTNSKTYIPKSDSDKNGSVSQKIIRTGQVYMLPSEVKDINDIGLPNSGERFRFTSEFYHDFFKGKVTDERPIPTVLPYEEKLYNFLTQSTPTYAAIAKVNEDGKTITPLTDEIKISTSKKYYDFPAISGEKGTKYVVVYGYWTTGSVTNSNIIQINVKE